MLSGEGRNHLARSGRPLRTWPTAGTALAGVIGNPVEHSLSPALHNAALVDLGLDWAYVAFPVPAGHGEAAVAAMVELGIRGLSVTMPYKAPAARACQRLNPVAERLGAVNTVTNLGGYLVGDSTDGPGFMDALTDQGWEAARKRCLVLGAGGAARAVVLALAEAGAGRVGVVARRPEQAEDAASVGGWRRSRWARSNRQRKRSWWSTPRRWGWPGSRATSPGISPFGLDPKRLGAWPTGGRPHLRSRHDQPTG